LGIEKAYELARARWVKARNSYSARLHAVGLACLDDRKYTGPSVSSGGPYEPRSREAWELHEELLNREGGVDQKEAERIRDGIGRVRTAEKMEEILSGLTADDLLPSAIKFCDPVSKAYLQTVAGREELELIAMQALGLDGTTSYSFLYQKVSMRKTFGTESAERVYMGRPME